MTDYYTVLAKQIGETTNDPARLRQVVYEAARLALDRELRTHEPPLPAAEAERHMRELENAIARLEADANGRTAGVRGGREEAAPAMAASPAHGEAVNEIGAMPVRAMPRRSATYLVNPNDFVNPAVNKREPSAWLPSPRLLLGLKIAFQIAVAILAGVALYFAVWGRVTPTQLARSNSPAAPAASPPAPPTDAVATSLAANRPAESGPAGTAPAAIAPPETAPTAPAPAEPVPVEAEPAAARETGAIAAGGPAPAAPFPLPSAYGVYAIEGSQLIALEPVVAAPVDPRTPDRLRIVTPSRTMIAAARPAFVIYRRGLAASPPERVKARIAAKLAQALSVDSAGKALVATPASDTWIIRDQGYDMRVTPVRDSAEMAVLQPEKDGVVFPPGRYELWIGGQPYDFVIAGAVTDPAHCVESVATVRGPAYSECKSL
jgi:hypothetical protein